MPESCVWEFKDLIALIKGMLVNCELPKPLRPNVKVDRSLRKDQQEQEHTQANEAKHHHFDFSVPQTHLCAKTPVLRVDVAAVRQEQ